MNRKWLVGGVAAILAIAAVLALVGGGVVGRSIVSEPPAPERPPSTTRFFDTLTDVAISYPATWARRISKDQAVRLVASSPDASAGVSVSVRKTELDTVTAETLPIVRSLTDDLLRQDSRIVKLTDPIAVTVGGLPGYRYVYTYRTKVGEEKGEGAHIHYYLFKGQRLIQIVLQAVPSAKLGELQATFDKIAGTFEGTRR